MNASATIRASYVRESICHNQPVQYGRPIQHGQPALHDQSTHADQPARPRPASPPGNPFVRPSPHGGFHPRPARSGLMSSFKPVDHLHYREECQQERRFPAPISTSLFPSEKAAPQHIETLPTSYLDMTDGDDSNDDRNTPSKRIRRMLTTFPYRDPKYLVAILFATGSLILTIEAIFDLVPRINPALASEHNASVTIPTTLLLGAIFFLIAGVFDIFAGVNADCGSLVTSKSYAGVAAVQRYRPALLGSEAWTWAPSRLKLYALARRNLAFQAGIIALMAGVLFVFGGIVFFPGVVPEDSAFFSFVVFAPQVVHGFLFFLANFILALSEQDHWWKLKVRDADWASAALNALGGLGFMVSGLLLWNERDVGRAAIEGMEERGESNPTSAIVGLMGGLAFLMGSVVRWYVVMEYS